MSHCILLFCRNDSFLFCFCHQRGNEVASVGWWLAGPSYITQCVPDTRRGPGIFWLYSPRGQIWHLWGCFCQIRRCCCHVFHLKRFEETVSLVFKLFFGSSRSVIILVILMTRVWFVFFSDADTTCRMMSGKISTKQSTPGSWPSARRGSSWVETNPTWQTWWGHAAVSIFIFYTSINTQMEGKYINYSDQSIVILTLLLFLSFNPFPLSAGCVWCSQSDGGPAGLWWHDGEHQGEKLVQACGECVAQPRGTELKQTWAVKDW